MVDQSGAPTVTADHLITVIAACAAHPDALAALRKLLDDAVILAARVDAETPRVATTSKGLERLLCETLDAVPVK